MKFSIIVPCHQDNLVVRECIQKILLQKKNHELIIACDNFNFDFKNEEVKVIKSMKKLYANGIRNLGAEYSQGDYLIFIDSDIIVEEDFIHKIENYVKKNSADILSFPTKAENSENIFAIYKGYKENYQTDYLLRKIYKNINIPFFGYAVLFRRKVFFDLDGWPVKSDYDYIMEHEGFQKKINESSYLNQVVFDIQVNHYHHKNLKLFTNVIFRTAIWVVKKLRGEVDIDTFKSKKNGLISITAFLLLPTLMINFNISLFIFLIYLMLDREFLYFLYKKNKLFFLIFFVIHLIYFTCIALGALKGIKDFIFLKK